MDTHSCGSICTWAVALAVSVGLNWTDYAFLESGGVYGALGGLSAS